jgi:hypothetical protein
MPRVHLICMELNPHFSRPVKNECGVPTFVGVSREGFRPGKLLPQQLAEGEQCETFRLRCPS